MKRMQVILAVMLSCAVFWCQGAAVAQHGRTYSPSRPTLSPYLNLFRRDAGAVDNYNSFVRPEIEMQNTLQEQETAVTQQSGRLRLLDRQVERLEGTSSARSTGAGSRFMNYSHYFQSGRASSFRSPIVPRR